MVDPEIQAMMTQTVRYAPCLGRTDHGDAQYPAPYLTLMARVEPRVEFVRTSAEGEEVNSSLAVLTTTKVAEGTKLWVPGTNPQDPEQGRTVKSVAPMYDEDGSVSHYEVLA